jgi:hypothetical protein
MNTNTDLSPMFKVEVTDTFGGEANYSWVNRFEVDYLKTNSRLAIVRAAKKAAGWAGLRCQTSDFGDTIEVRQVGRNHPLLVMFIECY